MERDTSYLHSHILDFLKELGREVTTCCRCRGRAQIFGVDGLIELRVCEMFCDIRRQWDFSIFLKHFEPFVVWHGDFYQSTSIGLPYYFQRHTIFENNLPSCFESFSGETHDLPDIRSGVSEEEAFHWLSQ
jgi:hypothetical protein